MKDSIAHIFLTRFATLINDSKHPTNRICVGLFLLLGFIIPHFVQAQHIDNRKRLDSFQRARAATGATILKVLANSYNVTGGGAYCIGGSGVVVGLDGSQLDTTYQLQLNGVNIGSPVTGDGNAISFGLQTAAGTYTVFANTSTGPMAMGGNVLVTINPLPTVTADPKQVCFGNNAIVLTGTPAGGSWSGTGVSGSTFNANGLAAGNYTVTYSYTDANSCNNSTTATVSVNALPTVTADNKQICIGNNAVALTGTPAGGSWSGTGVSGSTFNANGLAAGNYTVTYSYTDANSCTNTANATVTVNALPSVTANNKQVCFGNNSVVFTGTPAGGTWSGTGVSGSTFNANGLAAGNYTVTYSYTDGNGCVNTAAAIVTVNALPTPAAGSNTPQCAGGTLNLTSTNGTTYSWTGPNSFTSDQQNPSIVNVTTAASGVYTVVVTDGNGCSATTTTNVTINALPIPSAGSNTPQCAGSTLNFTASGGTNYSWSGPNGFTSNSPNPSIANITTAASGVYTVVVTDGNGCSATTTTNVTINALPTPTANSNTPQCAGSTLNLTASSGANYSWTGPNGFTSNSPNPSITNVTTAASGTYTVVVTNASGCSATTTTNVTINALPTPTANSNTPQCAGSTLNFTASGGANYSWTGPNGFTSNLPNPSIANVTTAASGVYTVVVTDENGCSATTTTNVTINALPTPTAGSNTPQCAGSTLNLTANGGTGYNWSGPNGFTSTTPNPSITNVTTAASGVYTVVVTDGNGCSATTTTNVAITPLPTATISYSATPYCISISSAQAVTLSGTNAYTGGTYTATPGGLSINSSTGAITPSTSTAGTYTVTYTTPASSGCAAVTATTSVTITAVPTATISYTGSPFCTTVSSATVTLTGTGAYTGGTYTAAPAGLNINSATGDINPSASTPGTYTVTYAIPASGGCAGVNVTTPVTITALPTVNLTYAGTPFCRSVATGQAATLSGTGAYTGGTFTSSPGGLSINGSTGAITPSTSTAGSYTVTYTTPASGGCATVSTTANIIITAVPTATISYTGTPFCTTLGSAPVTLAGTGAYTGGTYTAAPAGLTINGSTGEITPSSSTAGTYTITYAIPASGGCAAVNVTTSVTITAQPTASLFYAGTPFCRSVATAQNPTLTGTNAYTGGTYTAPAGLTINSGTGAITPSTSTAGTYTVTYTKVAAGGCAAVVATTSVTITAVPTATISYTGTPFCTTLGSAPVTLTGTGAYTGGTFSSTAGLTINSSTGEITPSSSTAGTYTITYAIPASGGCAAVNVTTSVTITAQPTASLSYVGTPFCKTASTQNPVLTGTGAYTGGTYSAAPAGLTINSGTGVITPSSSTAGTYTITYTKVAAGGCAAVNATANVTITAVPTATISYIGTPFCTTVGSATVTLTGTGAYTGGTYTAAPAGLTINGSTGEITPSSSTAGTYTITYAIPASGGCAAVNVTTSVTITAQPTASLAYAGAPFCKTASTQNPTLTGTGIYTGGTYSTAPAGLTINSSTGVITPSSSTAGTYTITYSKPAAGGCAAVTATSSVTITAAPTATISYAGTPFCTTVSSAPVSLSGTNAYTGGTFSSTAGLTINSSTGEITPSSSTAGTYTITYAIPASGGCAAVNVTTSVTITAQPTASLAYAGAPFCKTASTQNPTLTGTGVYTGGTYSAAPAGLTINSGTGVITPSSSTAGTYTITYSKPAAGGCAAVTATSSVTITAAPTATISYAGTPFCTSVNSASVTLSGTGAYTGGTFSAPAGLTINSTTGAITPSSSTAGTYTITYTAPSSGGCAAVNATTSVTINASPTVSVTPPSAAFCSGNSVTLTASGASTYTWSPSTNLSITTGSVVIAYPDVTTTYTVTGTAANGCTGTASVPITVTTSPEGDLSSSPPVCPGSNSGTITLSNYTGSIIRWETSTDGGTSWTTINNTSTTFPYLNLTTTTIYRVYLQLNGCFAYSDVGIVPVNPPFTPTVTVNPTSICPGQSATLKASDYGPPPFPTEDFQNANPAGWSGNDANNNNKGDNSEWGETGNGKMFNGLLWNSNAPPTNSKYMIVNGNGGGSVVSLITPPFSLVGLTNPIFNYYTAMNLNAGTTAWVEITTDGGATYNTLKTYTGPTNVGNPNNGFIQESINMSAYIGQSNVKVRFRYSGTAGSNWGVDNVGIAGTYQPVTYQWSPLTYLTPANGVGQTVTTTPTVSGTYNYCVVATTAAGCSSSPVCADVLVKPLPSCSITGTDSVCPASTNTYSAPGSLSAYSWSITGKGTISGSSTSQTVSVLASRTCGTYTLNLTTTLNGCTSTCSRTFTIYDTTRPVITITAAATLGCNPQASAITAAFGTATVTDNCTTGLIAAFTTGAEQGTGCIRTVTRTWTVTDSCGNSATASQTVSFTRDTQGPLFVGVPANATVQCGAIPAAPTVTANDNCSPSVAVTYGEVANVVEGCGTITRTWASTDLCGNTSTATQILTVVDTTRPVLIGVPVNETVQCTNTIIAGVSVTATDNCDPTITVNFTETNNVVQGCGTITRTWTATDNCGNTATATQVVTVVDNTAPVAVAPASLNFQCIADVPPAGTLTATDNCSGNITATGVDVQVANGCGYTITRTWTFTDACSNTSSVSQIINVRDDIPPVITCPPAQVFCAVNGNTYTIPPATATDNCSGTLNITYQITGATTRSGTGNDASGVFNVGISTITWTATDICGNTSTCSTTVTINPKPAPIISHN